jgi:hypothetical protein
MSSGKMYLWANVLRANVIEPSNGFAKEEFHL